MAGAKVKLLLHPTHLRIIDAIEGRQLTAQQLTKLLPEIAQATLYRHLNRLVEAGILVVVEERPVRGTLEKLYTISEPVSITLTHEDLAQFSREDLVRYFNNYRMLQTIRFQRYLQQEQIDIANDGIRFWQIPLYLSNEEYQQLFDEIQKLLLAFSHYPPMPGRRRRMGGVIFIPEVDSFEGKEKTLEQTQEDA